MKIVINKCYGGFSISKEVGKRLLELGIEDPFKNEIEEELSSEWYGYMFDYAENRYHPKLIQVIEELKNNAEGECASLKIVEVPDDVEWYIDEYDGIEHIAEKHRTWS